MPNRVDSGETAQLGLHCLQKLIIACGSEREPVLTFEVVFYDFLTGQKKKKSDEKATYSVSDSAV